MPTYVVRATLTVEMDVELMIDVVDVQSFAAVEKEIKAGRFDDQLFHKANGDAMHNNVIKVKKIKLIEEIDDQSLATSIC